VVVAAAGNNGLTIEMTAPACLSGVLSVAASDVDDDMAAFSNTSRTTDVVAPGDSVVSDAIGGGTIGASGTSMASPAVAGCVALLRDARPTATVAEIEAVLRSTGTPVTRGNTTLPRINCDAALLTLQRPDPPRAVRAVSGTTTTSTGPARVSFTPGASNASAITSFTATCVSSNGGVTRTKVGPASPITFTALTTAKSYACSVTGTNPFGASAASAASPVMIVGAPASPTGVTAKRIASGQLRVAFTPGANNGAAVTSYTASCVSSNGGAKRATSGAGSPLTVTTLAAGKTYRCTVKATNARGSGVPSTPSAPRTA
jgi:hypothetical protein